MKKNIGRPKKRPDAKKQKVTVTLDPTSYAGAQKLCFDEGISISEKIDRLFRELIDSQKKKGREEVERGLSKMGGDNEGGE